MEWSALILISVFFVLLLLNVPISFCIGLATLCTMLLSMDLLPAVTTLAQRMAGGLNSFALLAIPFFVLSGLLMGRGGIAKTHRPARPALPPAHCNDAACPARVAFSGGANGRTGQGAGLCQTLRQGHKDI